MKALLVDQELPPWFPHALRRRGIESQLLKPPVNEWPDLADIDLLLVRGAIRVSADLIASAPRLRFILRPGSGTELIDKLAVRQRGIVLLNSPEGNAPTVAEHTLSLILALLRRLPEDLRTIALHQWHRYSVGRKELADLTVGILGFGHIGRELARRIVPLARKVFVYDRYLPAGYATMVPGVEEVDFNQLPQLSDIVSVHVDMRPPNHHWINASFFQKMKPSAYLINTSRGEVVCLDDLIDALDNGRLGGVALDVLEDEPPLPDHINRLQQYPNVIVTPHIAGWSEASYHRIYAVLLEKLDAYLT